MQRRAEYRMVVIEGELRRRRRERTMIPDRTIHDELLERRLAAVAAAAALQRRHYVGEMESGGFELGESLDEGR